MARTSAGSSHNHSHGGAPPPPQQRPPGFSHSLVRKLVLFPPPSSAANNTTQQRMSNDATAMAGELLRLFVIETRNRASILAECEQEGTAMMMNDENDDENAKNQHQIAIRSDHVAQVAAEILMDFS